MPWFVAIPEAGCWVERARIRGMLVATPEIGRRTLIITGLASATALLLSPGRLPAPAPGADRRHQPAVRPRPPPGRDGQDLYDRERPHGAARRDRSRLRPHP